MSNVHKMQVTVILSLKQQMLIKTVATPGTVWAVHNALGIVDSPHSALGIVDSPHQALCGLSTMPKAPRPWISALTEFKS